MNIYIELEIYNREIESKILLAISALKEGLKVFIGQRSIIQKMALNGDLSPGIIHMKDANCDKNIINNIKNLSKKKFLFTAQDEELGVMSENFQEFARIRFTNLKIFKYLVYYYCLGPRDSKYLSAKGKKNKLIQCGSPRFDILKIKSKKNYKKKPQITIVCNFNIFGTSNLADRVFNNYSHDEYSTLKEQYLYNKEKIQLEKVYEFIKLARYLSKKFPKKKILIRPHPKDKFEIWKKILGYKNKNLDLDANTNISETILQSEFIIQNGCTSSIESYFLNSKCISYLPNNWPEDVHGKFAKYFSINANTKEEVFRIIKKNNKYKKIDMSIQIKKRIYIKEKNASEIIINSWKKILFNNKVSISKRNNIRKIIFLNKLKFLTKKILFIKENKIDNTFPDFTTQKLNLIASKIKKNLNFREKISIKKLNNKLIYFETIK